MRKLKKKHPAKREQASRKVSRQRATRRWMRHATRVAIVAAVLGVGGYGAWITQTDRITALQDASWQAASDFAADAGLVVRHVYLEGREHAALGEVMEAIHIKEGDPLLLYSVDEIKENLEVLGWVNRVEVSREFPDTLHIRIIEREPAALWQHEKKISLIDVDGEVISQSDVADWAQLPVVVGDDAAGHTRDLLAFLIQTPELFAQVASAIRVSERRWNIRFRDGLEVKLPEKDPQAAWRVLADMDKDKKLLERNIRAVDLRVPDRVFIQVAPGILTPGGTGPARGA